MKNEPHNAVWVFWSHTQPSGAGPVPDGERLRQALPHSLAARIGRYRNGQAQWQSLCGKYLLWYALAKTGQASALRSIVYQPNGRPADPSGRFDFSLSHSGSVVVVAVSRRSVGVDVQEVTQFTPAHRRFMGLPDSMTSPADCSGAWAKREALYKASQWPWNVVVRDLSIDLKHQISYGNQAFRLQPLGLAAGYAGWLATESTAMPAVSMHYVPLSCLWLLAR